MTPLVEMNVPVGINRYVRGCLCADDHGHFFLMHRGTRFTVTPYVVTKAMAHEHFAEWLQWVDDGGQQTLMIPVGPIREDFVEHAAAFADQVAILKQMYAASQGHVEVAEATLESSDDVNLPQSSAEAPRRILRSVAVRDGQGEFRERLIDAYNGRCAVTRCNVEQVLEAAHILPFSEAGMNNLKNGLLLRADIHMLFDLGLIAVDTAKHPPRLVLSEKLRRTTYAFLDGRRIRLPSRRAYWPSHEALAMHRENAGL